MHKGISLWAVLCIVAVVAFLVSSAACTIGQVSQPRPTATPWGIGGPELTRISNPEIRAIIERLTNPETAGQVPEEDILALNQAILEHAQAAQATATAEAQKPTPTQEVKKDVPCGILPDQYCSQAERIQITIGGITYTYLAFNFPPGSPSEVPLFTPMDGRLLDKVEESGDPFSGFSARIYRPDPPGGAYIVRGDLRFDDMLQVKNPKKSDKIIGYVKTNGVKNYGANVLVTVTKRSPDGAVTDETLLKNLFHLR